MIAKKYQTVLNNIMSAEWGSDVVVEKVMDLPTMSIQLLSEIMRKNEISHRELNKKHFLLLDGNIDHILIL